MDILNTLCANDSPAPAGPLLSRVRVERFKFSQILLFILSCMWRKPRDLSLPDKQAIVHSDFRLAFPRDR